MRIIAGTARSLPLKTPEGIDTRPTSDRIKETLFNMIQADMPGCYFLDLFAGSGQIGLEALSRGAAYAVFADHSKKACACIEQNIKFTHMEQRARLLMMDVLAAMRLLQYEKNTLAYLKNSAILKDSGTVIVEASLETDFSYAAELGFVIRKEKNYKTNKHIFLTKEG